MREVIGMRFRTGLVVGLAAGYVLGAKAGRERYEQIRNAAESLWSSEGGRRLREEAGRAIAEVREQANEVARKMRGDDGMIDVTDAAIGTYAAQ
jgi:hypothetical protein